ncbi:MAG: hypothetical protein ABSG04_11465 [Verrucomicrobiota bacterium]|jgi:hypothetical protein
MNNENADNPPPYFPTIVFVIQVAPEMRTVEEGTWSRIVKKLESDPSHTKGVQTLTAGTYLINVIDGLPFLGLAIYQCDQEKLHYRVVVFQDAPNIQDFYEQLSPVPANQRS